MKKRLNSNITVPEVIELMWLSKQTKRIKLGRKEKEDLNRQEVFINNRGVAYSRATVAHAQHEFLHKR